LVADPNLTILLNRLDTASPMERLLHSAVVVSQHSHVRRLIEIMPDAEPCNVMFVEAPAHAYSLITRVAPDVVIVSLEIGDADAFRLLSMLTLDKRTRHIPVVIRTTRREPADERPSKQINDVVPMN
jgi:CheY-like chemotaxis protein